MPAETFPAGDDDLPGDEAGDDPDGTPPGMLVSADSRGGYAVPRQLDSRNTRRRKR